MGFTLGVQRRGGAGGATAVQQALAKTKMAKMKMEETKMAQTMVVVDVVYTSGSQRVAPLCSAITLPLSLRVPPLT